MGAERGTLTLMVGGDAAVLDAARPALDPFAGLIVHVGGPGMGQVVKLCNQLVYAAQMLAVAEAATMAAKSGVDLGLLYEVLTHATGDCVALRTRLPFEGAIPDSPASNGWKPGFMTDLMAKTSTSCSAYAARFGCPPLTSGSRKPDTRRREHRGLRTRRLLGARQGGALPRGVALTNRRFGRLHAADPRVVRGIGVRECRGDPRAHRRSDRRALRAELDSEEAPHRAGPEGERGVAALVTGGDLVNRLRHCAEPFGADVRRLGIPSADRCPATAPTHAIARVEQEPLEVCRAKPRGITGDREVLHHVERKLGCGGADVPEPRHPAAGCTRSRRSRRRR